MFNAKTEELRREWMLNELRTTRKAVYVMIARGLLPMHLSPAALDAAIRLLDARGREDMLETAAAESREAALEKDFPR